VTALWPFIFAGIADGAVYALAAVGLVLTFRISGVFNFAHGSLAAASAYSFYELRVNRGMPWGWAALITFFGVGMLGGLLLERVAFWLSDAPTMLRVVATVGILVALLSFLTGHYGSQTLTMDPYLPRGGWNVAGTTIHYSQVITFVVGAAGTAGLYVFFKRSRLGIAMQAVVDNAPLVSMGGTSPVLVRRVAWVIGSCYVSVSGMLLAPDVGVDVNTLTLLVISAFGAAAVGAFNNLPLTFVGGVGLGVASSVMAYKTATIDSVFVQQLYINLPFIVLVVALVAYPRRYLIERGTERIRRLRPAPTFALPVQLGAVLISLVGAVLIPFMVGSKINAFTAGLCFVIIFSGLALVLWTSGQVPLGQMAFAAIGASTFAHAHHSGFPWLVALLAAGLVLLPIAAVLAVLAIRLSGVYLAVLTFGFGILIERLFFTTGLMFGHSDVSEVGRPHLFGGALQTESDRGYYFATLAITAVCLGLVAMVRKNRLGRLLRGFGDSPAAVRAHGADTTIMGVLVFCVSAFVSGIAGALLAGVTGSAAGSSFGFTVSLTMIAVLVACTLFTFGAPMPVTLSIIAAFIYQVSKVYFTAGWFIDYQGLGLGLAAIGVACGPGIAAGLRGRPRLGRAAERVAGRGPARARWVAVTQRSTS
jgi:branched-subunit amino acid ABC-type transport system permease component